MINQKTIFFIVIAFFINLKTLAIESVYIVYKIGDEIITNIDIKNESQYLISLNQQLQSLSKKRLLEISKQSIIKEIVKKNEIVKYFTLDQSDPYIEEYIKDLYLRLGLKNLNELDEYLGEFNLTTDDIKKKIEVETFWNKLIYDKYIAQISINNDVIKQKINERKKTANKRLYSLSEIVFEKEVNVSIDDRIKQISESIQEIGFKNTANLYSISDSSKFGGNIGWVEENSLAVEISKVLKNTKVGDYIKPIQLGANFLILKIEDIKFEKLEIDEEKEFQKIVQFEKNKQLDRFSQIYYNKIKINVNINEL